MSEMSEEMSDGDKRMSDGDKRNGLYINKLQAAPSDRFSNFQYPISQSKE